MDYGPEVREEVKAGYVSIRARGMQRDVTQLLTTLDKIRAPPAGKGDLLGGSGSGVGGVGGLGEWSRVVF